MLKIENLKSGILKGISFEINDRIFLVFGKNGSGKTTLAESIMGFKNYSGNIFFMNKKIDNLSITERANLGITIMPQILPKYKMKVKDYLSITVDNIDEALSSLGIEYVKDKNIEELSGGERKKVEFVSAVFSNFKLIILDEPDSGVDIYTIPKMKEIILKSNKSFIIITHNIDALNLGKGIILEDGKIKYKGDISGFFGNK